MSVDTIRRDYSGRELNELEAGPNPLRLFEKWFAEAMDAEPRDPNAMTLATVSPTGVPSARIVLLKSFDEGEFLFFTNYHSAKGHDLDANPLACLLFFWAQLERQVRVTGRVRRIAREQSEAYFHSRPFESQLGAWASLQSSVIESRAELESRYVVLQHQYEGQTIPLPDYWGGYQLAPTEIEFWQGRPSRLHDRLRYARGDDGKWSRVRLSP
jgi:pyridoxamine 5'-phosphate oxidase